MSKFPLARAMFEAEKWGHSFPKYNANGINKCCHEGCIATFTTLNWNVQFSQYRKNCPMKAY